MSSNSTLGGFLSDILHQREMTNKALAQGAGISESVVSNLLRHGISEKAKEPDPKTLRAVAEFLDIDPVILFRLAGYLPAPKHYSAYAQYVASVFDKLPPEKQTSIVGVIEALAEDETDKMLLQTIRDEGFEESAQALLGIDEALPHLLRVAANSLLTGGQYMDPRDVSQVAPDAQVWPGGQFFSLPRKTQQRIIALMRAKLGLDYDPTMVDEEWRD